MAAVLLPLRPRIGDNGRGGHPDDGLVVQAVDQPMTWEWRGDTTFFYHPRRIGGRVVKVYLGSGPQAQLAADLIVEVRERRAALVQALKQEQEHWGSMGVMMGRLDRACDVMERAALLAEGEPDARRRRRVPAAAPTGGGRRPRAR